MSKAPLLLTLIKKVLQIRSTLDQGLIYDRLKTDRRLPHMKDTYKKLNSTMIYARAHDQTVAEDYCATMSRV